MKKNIGIMKIILVALALAFIWGNSMLPGDLSNLESSFVERLLEPVLQTIQRALSRWGVVVSQSHLVRKLAHFTEYMVLGALMCALFIGPDGRGRFFAAELSCLAAAFIDEGIQMFSDGRGPGLRDVALDFSGATLGVLIVTLVLLLLRLRRRPKPPDGT